MVSTRSEMRTMRSIGAKTRITPGPFGLSQQPAQAKDHAALVLGEDLDGRKQVQTYDDDDHDGG